MFKIKINHTVKTVGKKKNKISVCKYTHILHRHLQFFFTHIPWLTANCFSSSIGSGSDGKTSTHCLETWPPRSPDRNAMCLQMHEPYRVSRPPQPASAEWLGQGGSSRKVIRGRNAVTRPSEISCLQAGKERQTPGSRSGIDFCFVTLGETEKWMLITAGTRCFSDAVLAAAMSL